MNLQQLRYLVEIVRRGLNVTAAAEALHTSQPGVSKQMRALEDELGGELFLRSGKHLVALTPLGERVKAHAEQILGELESIRRAGRDARAPDRGSLAIATTHTQARYALPPAVRSFRRRYPQVSLHLHQGTPMQIAEMAANGTADLAIATEALELFEDLVLLPCYRWNRCLVLRPDHPLAGVERVSLAQIADQPLITYVFGFTGSSQMTETFRAHGMEPQVVLTATDAEVIKTYVREGLGVGIMAAMAYDRERDRDLACIDVSHLFPDSITSIGLRAGVQLRRYVEDFIKAFAPHLDGQLLAAAIGARSRRQREQIFASQLPYLTRR